MLKTVLWPPPGRYVLAVSGGADSMALLDLMAQAAPGHHYELVVAHYDHGLRPDSSADRDLVGAAAARYKLPFATEAGRLGRASEATARAARYKFLEQVRRQHHAQSIVTAHHQDDLLETSLLNLARGTGRHGLAPMQNPDILRPLIGVPRAALRSYAQDRGLAWHDDPTNADLANPRNFLRRELLAIASPAWRRQYLELIDKAARLNHGIDRRLAGLTGSAGPLTGGLSFPRSLIRDLSLPELSELIRSAAQSLQPAIELESRLLQELALFAKTGRPGRRRPLRHSLELSLHKGGISLCRRQN